MQKQLATITDFSGNMNLEDDPSDLSSNEATELVNLVPYGKGLLKLDRSRVEINQLYQKTSADHQTCYASRTWKDGAGNMIIPFIVRTDATNNIYQYYAYHTSSFGTGSPTWSGGAQINTYSAVFRANRNSFYSYGGVLRFCNSGSNMTYMLNFTDRNGSGRNRFNSAETLTGINLYTTYGKTATTGMHDGTAAFVPKISICDSLSRNEDNSAKTYDGNEIGLSPYIGSAVSSSYGDGDIVNWGVSFEIDYIQETPMSVPEAGEAMLTFGAGDVGDAAGLYLFAPDTLNDRVTAINLYRSLNGGEYYLWRRVDIQNGTHTDGGTHADWVDHTATYNTYSCTLSDYGYALTETYLARTGYTDYAQWTFHATTGVGTQLTYDPYTVLYGDIGCIFRNYALVNTNAYFRGSNTFYPEKRIAVSKPNMPDMFDPDHYLEFGREDSSRFTGIAPLGTERWVAWDPTHTYVVNASSGSPLGWFIENTYNVGLASGGGWCEVTGGLAFVNQSGVYLLGYDGSIQEPSRRIRSDFAKITPATAIPFFNARNNVLYVGNTGRTGGYKGYQLDFERKSWCWWDIGANADYIQGIDNGYDPDETYLTLAVPSLNYIQIHNIESSTGSLNTLYQSPDIDMGDYAVQKKGKHIYVKYKSSNALTVYVYLDGSTTQTMSTSLPLSATITKGKIDVPYRFNSIKIKITTTSNAGSFELYELSVEYKSNRPK